MSKTALITGASGGIGYALTLLFARDGYDCILVARSQDKLTELAARIESEYRVKALVIAKDLSRAGAVDEIYEAVTASMQVDVLSTTPASLSSASLTRQIWRLSWRCSRSMSSR